MLGGSPTVVMACGGEHTLVLMSCDFGHFGQLGHGDETDQLVLMLVAEMEECHCGGRWISKRGSGGRGKSVDVGVEKLRTQLGHNHSKTGSCQRYWQARHWVAQLPCLW